MIDLSHIEKIYDSPSGPVRAIKDISLHINRGEIYGIIGLSGAGKSTLVRCINLLEWPTSGSILLIRITFIGESANEPVISRLIKNFDLNVGSLFGSLDDIKGVPFGRLIISLDGRQLEIQEALEYVQKQNLKVEVIGYVSRHDSAHQ